jgi:tripartite ATP-independent transporter DctM subunit
MSFGIVISLIVFVLVIALGIPLGWGFLGSTIVGLWGLEESLSFTAGTFYHAINNYVLMGIAFFIFAGSLIAQAGLADRIVRFSYALVGKVRGGLIIVGIVASVIMGALTGSSLPVISALIPLLVPQLERYGYNRVYTTSVLCSCSFLGYLIPPSVPAMIYCLIAQQSVAALFLSTVIPGLLLAFGYGVVNYFICDKYIDESKAPPALEPHLRRKELFASTWAAIPALGCPAVILVGIYGGFFTPNEAGAIGVVYSIIVGFLVYGDLTMKRFWAAILGSIMTVGMIDLMMATGTVFTRLMIREGVAQTVASGILGIFDSKVMILLAMNAFLLLLGMFIDGTPILILAVPMILPLIKQIDVNLVQLGAIIIVNVGLGVVTPPFAISMFVGAKLADVKYVQLIKPMMVFLFLVGIPILLLTTFIPALSCWLPTVLLGIETVGPW